MLGKTNAYDLRHLKILGWACAALYTVISASAPAAEPNGEGEFSARGFDAVRIENEIKLAVPRDLTEEVWVYLTRRYGGSKSLLNQLDQGFSVTFADEHFIDRYFDDKELSLLARQHGIRHRSRIIDSDPTNRKNGRQLVQIKLNRGDDEALSRSEIKFPVKLTGPSRDPMDNHPLIGLVDRNHRAEFLAAVRELGLVPEDMRNTVTLDQRRRRVYISLHGKSFATITLDEVTSQKWWNKLQMTEVEMELNEIGYTEATPEERAKMEAINETMKEDLLAAFPRIVQDQTPKYNKAFNYFNAEYMAFPTAMKWGAPIEPFLGALPPLALMAGGIYVVRRRKQQHDPQ